MQLAHDYSFAAHGWLEQHQADLPSEENRFRARRDAITPAEALEVIEWHEFQITAKLARATRGRLAAEEDEDEQDADESWDIGSDWSDDDRDDEEIDMAAIHQSDADGSAKVALLGIEAPDRRLDHPAGRLSAGRRANPGLCAAAHAAAPPAGGSSAGGSHIPSPGVRRLIRFVLAIG